MAKQPIVKWEVTVVLTVDAPNALDACDRAALQIRGTATHVVVAVDGPVS